MHKVNELALFVTEKMFERKFLVSGAMEEGGVSGWICTREGCDLLFRIEYSSY